MKKNVFLLICITLVFLIVITKYTIAIDETKLLINTTVIENSADEQELYNNIYNFINKNDDLLIGLSSFETSNTLSENYDYLKNYAINYIIDNKKNYLDKITNNEIDINEIYKITNNVFGKSYFYIENNNKIKLEKDERRFNLEISNLKIEKSKENINAIVNYSNITYKYTLIDKKDRLIIENIEVL